MKSPEQQAQDELMRLCYGWCDDCLSDAEVKQLEALLKDDEEAQRYFAQAAAVTNALEQMGPVHSIKATVEPENVVKPRWPQAPSWRVALEVAAVFVALAAVTWAFLTVPPKEPVLASAPEKAPAVAEPHFAVISHTIGAVWPEGQQPLRAGAALGRGEMKLEEGVAHLQFYNGVKLVMEGPAELDIVSLEEAHCYRGKFFANVPPHAQGFLIHTPTGELVDHGTEFGLAVGDEGDSEVHVFSGEVFFQSKTSDEVTRLRQGEAARIDQLGRKLTLIAEPSAFFSDTATKEMHALEMEYQFSRWTFESRRWRKDPGLLAYYDFDQPDYLTGIIPAFTSDPYAADQEGVIIGARSTEGRWPGKGGLAFRRSSDRIRVRIPGYYDALTFAAWVRIDSLEDRTHSLLMSDGFDHGSVHWQFHGGSGQLLLTTRRESEEIATYASPKVIDQRLVGQWQHLAMVYDRLQGEVVHYLNGKEVSRQPLEVDVRLRVGVGEIGNWGLTRDGQPNDHNLLGVMDEFIVFDRGLETEEIQELVRSGEPG